MPDLLPAARWQSRPQVTVSKFIMAYGNHGKDAKLLPKPPAGLAESDSDDPDHDAPSSDVTQDALSKRNRRFLTKHGVKVSLSSEASGHGLFSVSDTLVGKELPAKGPWLDTLEKPVHTDTAKMLSQRAVRLDLAPAQAASGQPASSQGKAIFKFSRGKPVVVELRPSASMRGTGRAQAQRCRRRRHHNAEEEEEGGGHGWRRRGGGGGHGVRRAASSQGHGAQPMPGA